MKIIRLTLLFLLLSPIMAVAGKVTMVECGTEWINLHKNNPDLIGVYVQQIPDNNLGHIDYEGKHPCMIIYVFKDGVHHTVSYTPSGQVQNGVWGQLSKNDWVYKMLSKDLNLDKVCKYWYKK